MKATQDKVYQGAVWAQQREEENLGFCKLPVQPPPIRPPPVWPPPQGKHILFLLNHVNYEWTNTDLAEWDATESEDNPNAGDDSIEGVGS